ncbi:hypothetical protein D9M69_590710 [compost metagenome]
MRRFARAPFPGGKAVVAQQQLATGKGPDQLEIGGTAGKHRQPQTITLPLAVTDTAVAVIDDASAGIEKLCLILLPILGAHGLASSLGHCARLRRCDGKSQGEEENRAPDQGRRPSRLSMDDVASPSSTDRATSSTA